MKKKLVAQLALAGTVGLAAAFAAGTAAAAICSSCHTMHNSQDGAPMRGAGLTEPLPQLLLDTCIGCHTGQNNSAAGLLTSPQPEVLDNVGVPTLRTTDGVGGMLAGGNFYWVNAGFDRKGHNVSDLTANPTDDLIPGGNPPGDTSSFTTPLTCAGTSGCHGDRTVANSMAAMDGAHHYPHHTVADVLTHDTVGNSFRFLDGIDGREDAAWEYINSATDGAHNIYKGDSRNGTNETALTDTTTINYLCAECHGAFHNQYTGGAYVADTYGIVQNTSNVIGTGEWIRHPTDYDMPLTGEYGGYNAYKMLSPVGMTTVAAAINVGAAENRIVLCVSCHRAHASEYDDALRWDYADMETGASAVGETGCFACHTLKD